MPIIENFLQVAKKYDHEGGKGILQNNNFTFK